MKFVQGTTILQKLRNTKHCIKDKENKWRGMLLHDNVLPHTTTCTQALPKHFNWELFDNLRYRPDLAPSDYCLFTRAYLKNRARLQRFNNNNGLIEDV
jgi:hypothetical protein